MKDPKTFNAKNFKALRLKYKYSQKKLGNELHFKRQTISSWEHGKTNPSTETLFAVSDVYGMPSDEVFAICYCEREIIFPAEELLEETALTVTEESHGSIEEYTALITVPRAIAAVSCNALTTKAVTVPATREPNSYPPPKKRMHPVLKTGLITFAVSFFIALLIVIAGVVIFYFFGPNALENAIFELSGAEVLYLLILIFVPPLIAMGICAMILKIKKKRRKTK